MAFEEFVIAVIAVIGGLSLAGFIFWNVFSLIKQWINRKSGNADINPQFFKALGDFKKNTERRLANLEAIVSDMEEEQYKISDSEERKTMGEIEIEEEEVRSEKAEKTKEDNGGNLRNMLNE